MPRPDDPIGACIGPRGQRVAAVVGELNGEKIDIVRWHEEPEAYIAEALAPAEVTCVMLGSDHSCRAIVPDDQLSLAIGKEGQNARLAAKLTGWKIDIKPESELEFWRARMEEEREAELEELAHRAGDLDWEQSVEADDLEPELADQELPDEQESAGQTPGDAFSEQPALEDPDLQEQVQPSPDGADEEETGDDQSEDAKSF